RAPERLEALLRAGVDTVRLNMSHGTHDEHAAVVEAVRAFSVAQGRPVALLLDLCGPKIRTGPLRDGTVKLVDGTALTITTRPVPGDAMEVGTSYADLPRDVRPGDRILVDDGLIELQVESVTPTDVVCRVRHGGMLREHKGINLPGVAVSAPALTAKDEEDLAFGLALGV